jgi:hypothetical protein
MLKAFLRRALACLLVAILLVGGLGSPTALAGKKFGAGINRQFFDVKGSANRGILSCGAFVGFPRVRHAELWVGTQATSANDLSTYVLAEATVQAGNASIPATFLAVLTGGLVAM